MKKVTLERLQSHKFAKTIVNPEVMAKIKAGAAGQSEEYPNGPNGKKVTDTFSYSCCDGKYDCTTTFSDGYTFIRMRNKPWENTTPADYNPPVAS